MDLAGKLAIASVTDVGKNRDHNEDAIGAAPEIGLVVLADGMGGYQAGEIASAIAVSSILELVKNGVDALSSVDAEEMLESPHTALLEAAICTANARIFESASENSQYQGMGTTVVAAFIHDNILSIAHAGDSRLYRLREQELVQLTEDHSLVRELVRKGFYTEEEAKTATNKNVVTRALGIGPSVEVETQEEVALIDDIYLLCSDGLSDMIDDQVIADTLLHHGSDLQQAAETLIDLANVNGGKDNISVILMQPLKPFQANQTWTGKIASWFTS